MSLCTRWFWIEWQIDSLLPPTPPCEELRGHASNQVDADSDAGLTCKHTGNETRPGTFRCPGLVETWLEGGAAV
jgi:hypothetical protein